MLSPEARKALEAKYNLLKKSADVIRPPGSWCRYTRHGADGASCALGAIEQAVGRKWEIEKDAVGMKVVKDLAANIPGAIKVNERLSDVEPALCDVVGFNNGTDQETVVSWFDNTAAGMKCILDKDDAERREADHAQR